MTVNPYGGMILKIVWIQYVYQAASQMKEKHDLLKESYISSIQEPLNVQISIKIFMGCGCVPGTVKTGFP